MSTPLASFAALGGRKMLVVLIAVVVAVAIVVISLFRAVPGETLGQVLGFLEVVILAYMGANVVKAGSAAVADVLKKAPADSEDLPEKQGDA